MSHRKQTSLRRNLQSLVCSKPSGLLIPSLTSVVGLSSEPCIYFCGNSLGIQPKPTARYLEAQLDTWSSIGVGGHFTDLEDSPLKQWQLLSEQAAESMSKIVGAKAEEVAAMGTLTTNLHLLLASFYKPTETKHKILMDWKAFPSDHVCSTETRLLTSLLAVLILK